MTTRPPMQWMSHEYVIDDGVVIQAALDSANAIEVCNRLVSKVRMERQVFGRPWGSPKERREVSERERVVLYRRDGGVCSGCQLPVSLWDQVDHIIPVHAGGDSILANLQLMHPRCNNRKNGHIPNEVVREFANGDDACRQGVHCYHHVDSLCRATRTPVQHGGIWVTEMSCALGGDDPCSMCHCSHQTGLWS
jgi:5-methylcytosine-specific restriction endonuclease McrA